MAISGRRGDDRYDYDPYDDERYYDRRERRSGRPRHTGTRITGVEGNIA
jgi:hypothetical protein